MKRSWMAVVVSLGLATSLAQAGDHIPLEKTKTAILPSGGFYRLYEGSCHDKNVVSIASLDRMRRWCFNDGGELSCYRQSQEAAQVACARSGLAANEDGESLEMIR